MEAQLKQQMTKAFWDLLEEETSIPRDNYPRTQVLLEEIIHMLCNFVPNRKDIHEKIKTDLVGISWELQSKLIGWIEKFQAPIHDKITRGWSKRNFTISQFLKLYYSHLDVVHKEVSKSRQKLVNGENLFKPDVPETFTSNVPKNIKTGRSLQASGNGT